MKKSLTLCFILFLPIVTHAEGGQFETRAECWTETRIHHQLGKVDYKPAITPRQEKDLKLPEDLTYSPNKAYALGFVKADDTNPTPHVLIFNERTHLIKIDLPDNNSQFPPDIKWINEKMVFMRVRIAEIMGYDLIYDVEEEKVLYKETFVFGSITFDQWQAGCQNPAFKKDNFCQQRCISVENYLHQ